jgi:hypothetical protein
VIDLNLVIGIITVVSASLGVGWKLATVYYKDGGTWKIAQAYWKDAGIWK